MRILNDIRQIVVLAGLALVCSACGIKIPNLFPAATPVVIQHNPPEIPTIDIQPFLQDGCKTGEYGYLVCPEGSLLADLGCWHLLAAEPALGALQPAYPMLKCQLAYDKNPSDTGNFIYDEGCLLHSWVQYVIYVDDQYRPLVRLSDLQEVFAPIESPLEALSYAVAATGLDARFDIETPKEYKYEVDQIEETWIEEMSTSYRVQLFDTTICGCGPHMIKSVSVSVTRDGEISLGVPLDLFRDPRTDDICAD